MGMLLAALGVGILSYVGIVLLFPKAVPDDTGNHVRDALDKIYEENRSNDEQRSILRDQLNDEQPIVRLLFGSAIMRPVYLVGLQAGYQSNFMQLFLMMVGAFAITLGILYWTGFGLGAVPLALIVAYLIPYRHCRQKIAKRNHKFLDQFPDALDMIVRSVKSGFPLSVALQMLAENTENPVKEEFRQVVDDIALGRSLQQALQRLSTRINQPDIRFFVVVLSVQQETGGNLAEIIGNLSNIIRKRKQLRHKIHAMTSEGRATAWVLSLLPVAMFLVLYVMQRSYIEPLWTDPLGMMMFGGAISLIVICALVVKQMVNVDI